LVLHLYPPANIKLIDPPRIVASSKILEDFVSQNQHASEKEIIFDLDLLGPGEGLTLAYSGYSEDAILNSSVIDVETRKSGWKVEETYYTTETTEYYGTGIAEGGGTTFTSFQPYSSPGLLSKQISTYNGADVIALVALLLMGICVSAFLVWLLARMMYGSSKPFRGWRSLFKVFRV
jgi:hypothetical protein